MSEEILDIKQACELLGIKQRTMYTLLKERQIPALKIGGQWRFHKEAIIDMFRNEAQRNIISVGDTDES